MVLDASSHTPSSSSAISSTVASSTSSDGDEDETDSEDDTSTGAIGQIGASKSSRPRRSSRSSDELTVNLNDPDASQVLKGGKLGRRLHTGHLLKMVLQDAQTRLFFKAQAVVQSEIRHYVPSGDDLKWPDVLVGSCLMSYFVISLQVD